MTQPTKDAIHSRATELFMQEQSRHNLGETLPELNELKEAGFWEKAKQELRCNEYAGDPCDDFKEVEQQIKLERNALAENEQLKRTVKSLEEKLSEKPVPIEVIHSQSLSLTVPELHMTVKYAEPEPEKPKVYTIKIKGYCQAKMCRYTKRFLKLSWIAFKWTAKKTGWLTLLFFAKLEHLIEQR